MNKDYTEILIVQDKSSSMTDVRSETIDGFNGFLKEQQQLPGVCKLTLMQFNTTFDLVYSGVDIKDVKPLDLSTYVPTGYTALLDAIGRTIIEAGHRFYKMAEADRPGRVVIVIATDGEENSSEAFSAHSGGLEKVMKMIKHQNEHYNWQFLFLGADQDAIKAAASLGIRAEFAMNTANNTKGVTSAYAAMNQNIRTYRCSAASDSDTLSFTATQRAEQHDAGAKPSDPSTTV